MVDHGVGGHAIKQQQLGCARDEHAAKAWFEGVKTLADLAVQQPRERAPAASGGVVDGLGEGGVDRAKDHAGMLSRGEFDIEGVGGQVGPGPGQPRQSANRHIAGVIIQRRGAKRGRVGPGGPGLGGSTAHGGQGMAAGRANGGL